MNIYSLLLYLCSLPLWAVPIAYDPFELSFHSSTERDLAFVEHGGVKLFWVVKDLEEPMADQLEMAKERNRLVAIDFTDEAKVATSTNALSELLFVSEREPPNQRYLFNYQDIDYSKKMFFGCDYFSFHAGDKWHKIQIYKPGLIDEIATQINYIKENKKDVYVNLEELKDLRKQIYTNAIKALRIID